MSWYSCENCKNCDGESGDKLHCSYYGEYYYPSAANSCDHYSES